MRTQKYKIADLKGMTLQTITGPKSEFIQIEGLRFSDIPGRAVDIITGEAFISLTDNEFLDLLFKGETLVQRQGIALTAMFILDEPKKH